MVHCRCDIRFWVDRSIQAGTSSQFKRGLNEHGRSSLKWIDKISMKRVFFNDTVVVKPVQSPHAVLC